MNYKKNAIRLLLIVVLFFIANLVMAQTAGGLFPKGDRPGRLLFYSLLILSLFVALAIHELGHIIAGLFQGFRFELYIIGLLGIKRSGKKIKIYLNKNLAMMGGVAATVPVVQSPLNKQKFARVVIAGPIMSLLFAVIAFILFKIVSSGAARGFWFAAAACSTAIFFATTVPKKTGMFFTDRARFQRLIGNSKASLSEEAMLTLLTQYIIDNNSCKNISLEKARILQSEEEGSMSFWGYYYEYYYYKENSMKEEADIARQKLLSLKNITPPQLWKFISKEDPELLKIEESRSI